MAATVTTLDREIAREERVVGLRTDEPLTDAAIARRRLQIAAVLAAAGMLAVFAAFTANGWVKPASIAVALAFAVYAVRGDRHLRRLGVLRGDSLRITLVVANELLSSGALVQDRELLELTDRVRAAAGGIARAMAEHLRADCVRVRTVGPSGEVPIAAQHGSVRARVDDHQLAAGAARSLSPLALVGVDGRSVLAVPLQWPSGAVAVIEVVSATGDRFDDRDVAAIEWFGRGALAAVLAVP